MTRPVSRRAAGQHADRGRRCLGRRGVGHPGYYNEIVSPGPQYQACLWGCSPVPAFGPIWGPAGQASGSRGAELAAEVETRRTERKDWMAGNGGGRNLMALWPVTRGIRPSSAGPGTRVDRHRRADGRVFALHMTRSGSGRRDCWVRWSRNQCQLDGLVGRQPEGEDMQSTSSKVPKPRQWCGARFGTPSFPGCCPTPARLIFGGRCSGLQRRSTAAAEFHSVPQASRAAVVAALCHCQRHWAHDLENLPPSPASTSFFLPTRLTTVNTTPPHSAFFQTSPPPKPLLFSVHGLRPRHNPFPNL